MTLYEIDNQIAAALDAMVDPETGEIVGDFAALEELAAERNAKIENIALYIKNKEAEADAIKAEADKLTTRAKQAKRRAENLRQYLAFALDGQKFETPRVGLSFRRSVQVIADVEQLPQEYVKVKTEKSADKTAIKKAIQAGLEVTGAHLEERNNLQIK